MKRISWIVTLPLMLALVIFSLANRARVQLDFWPFSWQHEPVPLSWLLLGALFTGLLIGGLVMWHSGAKVRRRARDLRFDKTHLEREVIRLKREVDRAKDTASSAPAARQAPLSLTDDGAGRSLQRANEGR